MDNLLIKLNYKNDPRICILNGRKEFINRIGKAKPEILIDTNIEPKYLYGFILVFATTVSEVAESAPGVIHNLAEDGVLWFIYPRKSSKNNNPELSRDHGWDQLKACGFEPVRQVSVDDEMSGLRFRNVKFIKVRNKVKN